jgi:ADP-ribose pyrophosphatase
VKLVRDISLSAQGFLQVREVELQNRYEDGARSAPYRYLMVQRSRLDAVAIVLYRKGKAGLELILRSQLRPPLAFRGEYEVPLPETEGGPVQWELPAGLIEPGEHGHDGLHARAAAETLEEVGVIIAPERFRTLGPAASLSPGVIAEKIHFVSAEILDTDQWVVADGDGHVLESHSHSVFVSLATALAALDSGLLSDVKTEVGIRRAQALANALSAALQADGEERAHA